MTIAFVLVAAFLAISVHEVGHALGGRLHGMRLSMLIVGPVHIQREADGRLGWRLNRRLSLAGGVVSSVPTRTEGLRRAMLSFAAGGPVTSIVVGLLVFAVYVLSGLGGDAVPDGSLQDALAESSSAARRRLEAAGKSVLLSFDPTARMRAEGAVLLADGDAEAAYEKLREAYASLARERDWGSESIMAEIRRLCRARGLPDPGADG